MRHHGFLTVAAAVAVAVTGWILSRHDELDASEDRAASFREAYSRSGNKAPAEDPNGIRLNYFDAAWEKVLRDVAEQSQLTLVMDRVPHGRYARRDRTRYSLESVLRVLNTELESQGFRLLVQNRFLIVLQLDSARTRYARPTIPTAQSPPPAAGAQANPFTDAERRRNSMTEPEHGFGFPQPSTTRAVSNARILQNDASSAAQDDDQTTSRSPFAQSVTNPPRDLGEMVLRTVKVQNTKAVDLARSIYLVFESRAELIPNGLKGLPTFVVRAKEDSPEDSIPVFRIGIDQGNNDLLVESVRDRADHLVRLIGEMDRPEPPPGGETVKLVPDQGLPVTATKNLNDQVHRLAAMQQAAGVQPPESGRGNPAGGNSVQNPDGSTTMILRGDVDVQSIPDLGIIILKGNEEDVAKIAAIINRLEQLSVGSLPDIHLVPLEFVNSEAMAALLTTVYDRLSELRERGNNNEQQSIAVIPIVQPNAILILAPEAEMEGIQSLLAKLDTQLDPESEFKVIPLRNAIASQVVTTLESFYQEREGLGARVRAIADVRTNSIVVQGRANDLKEVTKLIDQIDSDEPGSVHRVQFFQLYHAQAEALAEVLNAALQAVSNPPQQTTGGGGGFGGFGGNQGAQELRDSKSIALEFLSSDGNARLIRSGILVDVRVTADVRSNQIMVTAPESSMGLMAALIRQMDGKPTATAEIKVFALENADAQQSVDLLTSIFENQNQEDQLGVQISGAEDAASSLIPVQFSADLRTNTIVAVGSAEALSVVHAILLRLDTDDTRKRTTQVIPLRNAPVELVSAAILDFLAQQQALQDSQDDLISNIERLRQEVVVAPDTNGNALIVSASPEYFSEIAQIIRELDATPPQVVIQALLVEVQLDNTDEFGVELGFQDPLLFSRSIINSIDDIVTLTQTTTQNNTQTTNQTVISQNPTPGFLFNNTTSPLGNNVDPAATNPSTIGTQGISNFSLGRQNSDLGFGGFVFSAQSEAVSVLIRALAAKRTVHVLSRPQIRTTHNNLATIQVGSEVPVVNGVVVTENIVTPTIEQRNTGIILEVTPRITPDGTIAMEVYAEKSSLSDAGVPVFTDATTGNTIQSQIRDVSIADTTVSVPNGQTIVIGGMITKTDETLERKVPWLGDMPIVGRAFRFDGTNTRRTELLIFLTPRIIFNDTDSEMIKQVESERLHFIESEAEEIHGPLYSVPPTGLNGQSFPQDDGFESSQDIDVYPLQGSRSERSQRFDPTDGEGTVHSEQPSGFRAEFRSDLDGAATPEIVPISGTRRREARAPSTERINSRLTGIEGESSEVEHARESWAQRFLKGSR